MYNNPLPPLPMSEDEFNDMYEKEAVAKETEKEIEIETYYDKIIAEYLRTTKL